MKQAHEPRAAPVDSLVQVHAIGHGRGKKRKAPAQPNKKGKAPARISNSGLKSEAGNPFPPVTNPKEATCFYCFEKAH